MIYRGRMMNCNKCNQILRITSEQVGGDSKGIPVFHRFAYCDTCGIREDLDDSNRSIEKNPVHKESENYNSSTTKKQGSKKDSALSIVAAICALVPCVNVVGIVLAIIDLATIKKGDNKKHLGSYFALVFGCICLLVSCAITGRNNNSNDNQTVDNSYIEESDNTDTSETDISDDIISENIVENSVEEENLNIAIAESNENMQLGDIGLKDDIYIGLSYVKRMSYLPTVLGKNDDIGSENEVILAFFDFYNNSDKTKDIEPSDITCYADGIQVEDVESYIKVECDGVKQYYREDAYPKTQMISVQDYEVPKGWNEIKFFYKSECVWTIHQDDVKEDDFSFESMYKNLIIERNVTNEGDCIYNGDYEIIYQGSLEYPYKNVIKGTVNYIVFKFTINNTGESPIDYSYVGYEMTAYQDNYYLGEADYTLDDKIDGYSNVYNIDSIEPGMSANVYIAFESLGTGGSLFMVYDEGYINSDIKGVVYVVE